MKAKLSFSRNHPIVLLAAGFVVIAGLRYAAPIINPVLMAVFVSIIIYQPIDWMIKKKSEPLLIHPDCDGEPGCSYFWAQRRYQPVT